MLQALARIGNHTFSEENMTAGILRSEAGKVAHEPANRLWRGKVHDVHRVLQEMMQVSWYNFTQEKTVNVNNYVQTKKKT